MILGECNYVHKIYFRVWFGRQTDIVSSHKTSFNPPFFLKCAVPSQEYGSCYLIVRFYVCCIFVWLLHFIVMLFRCFPLIVDVFPTVLVCYPDLFFYQSIYDFWTVYYCYLYSSNINEVVIGNGDYNAKRLNNFM